MPDFSTVYSLCPIVRRQRMKLFQRVVIADRERLVPFEQDVLWLRESQTEMRILHHGVVVKNAGTLNDFYGFLTSLESAVTDDIRSMARAYRINWESDLCIDAYVTITDRPLTEDTSPSGHAHNKEYDRKQYRSIPVGFGNWWFIHDKPLGEFDCRPTLDAVTVFEGSVFCTIGKRRLGRMPPAVTAFIGKHRGDANAAASTLSTEAT